MDTLVQVGSLSIKIATMDPHFNKYHSYTEDLMRK